MKKNLNKDNNIKMILKKCYYLNHPIKKDRTHLFSNFFLIKIGDIICGKFIHL
jgi:hypothetical protein